MAHGGNSGEGFEGKTYFANVKRVGGSTDNESYIELKTKVGESYEKESGEEDLLKWIEGQVKGLSIKKDPFDKKQEAELLELVLEDGDARYIWNTKFYQGREIINRLAGQAANGSIDGKLKIGIYNDNDGGYLHFYGRDADGEKMENKYTYDDFKDLRDGSDWSKVDTFFKEVLEKEVLPHIK